MYLCLPIFWLAARPPNIVLILVDDMGWRDLSCYGSNLHETPHIDQLARQGLRFTDAYAMPVCSPSRAALLTGKPPARLRMTIWAEGSRGGPTDRKLLQAESLHDLPHTETTLARHLQEAGYLTALVGKWHLGEASHFPETHGFDINIGGNHWGAPQTFFWPYRGRRHFAAEFRYVPHLEFGSPGEYLTDRLTDEALRIIDRAGQQPWFLYLAHYAPHTPIEAKEDDIRHFETRLRPDRQYRHAVYAAMIKSLDDSVGRIVKHLIDIGQWENTILVFASDNGGYIGIDRYRQIPVTDNAPLRSGKGSLYEGGLRIPLIIRWPGVTAPESECRQPVVLMDLFPTLLSAAAGPRKSEGIDGLDLRAVLRQPDQPLDRSELFFHYPHYYHAPPTTPVSAIRSGDWKLIEFLEADRVELYDLATDLSESINRSAEMPERAAALRRRLHQWRDEVEAAMPTGNPNFSR